MQSLVKEIIWIQSNYRTIIEKGKIEELGEKPVSVPYYELSVSTLLLCRSQLPRGLRRRFAAVRLLRLWFGIPSGAWTFVCCECCVSTDGGLCDELITRPEDSYRVWCVVVRDLETSWMRRPCPLGGCRAKYKLTKHYYYDHTTQCKAV